MLPLPRGAEPCLRGARVLAATAVAAALAGGFTLLPATATTRSEDTGYVDYAPNGMPDFSQCRPEWSQPGSPGQWTYAGPNQTEGNAQGVAFMDAVGRYFYLTLKADF